MTSLKPFARVVSTLLVVSACADSPTVPYAEPEPTGMPSFSVFDDGIPILARNAPGAASTASAVIGKAGGEISTGGVTLVVPRNALRAPVQITVSVPAGVAVTAQFEPHGLKFRRAVTISYSLAGTPAVDALAGEVFGLYHVDDASDGRVFALEEFKAEVANQTASISTTHFSSYSFFWAKGFILVGN